jgi:hypothetical protein
MALSAQQLRALSATKKSIASASPLVKEQSLNGIQEAVSQAVRDKFGTKGTNSSPGVYCYVQETYEDQAVYQCEAPPNGQQLYRIGYRYDATTGKAELVGEPVKVRLHREYVDVPDEK